MPDKTFAQKLSIKPGQRVLLINSQASTAGLLGPLPDGVQLETALEQAAGANVALLFAHHRADLERLLPDLLAALASNAIPWVIYHKGTSPVKTDINRDSIWEYAKTIGFTAVSNVSGDEDWSAVRLKKVTAGS